MCDQEVYIQAWNFASVAHEGQFVPSSNKPYINHIGLVAMEVMIAAGKEQTEDTTLAVVCALLHDTIEDTSVSYSDIVDVFGAAIADGVMALTKDKSLPTKQEQMLDSLCRIKQQPSEISMVKLADRITNLQPPPSHWNKIKIENYRLEAELILKELGSSNELLALRLANKIDNYRQYL